MTKPRAPDSIEDAVVQSVALLGANTIAMVLSANAGGQTVSESLITKWGDPEAPQRIPLHYALAIEQLLVKTQHPPIFTELFNRLQPLPPAAPEPAPNPLREAIHAVSRATELMEGIDRAMLDGQLDRGELNKIEHRTHAAQKQIARVRRVVRSLLDLPATRGRG